MMARKVGEVVVIEAVLMTISIAFDIVFCCLLVK